RLPQKAMASSTSNFLLRVGSFLVSVVPGVRVEEHIVLGPVVPVRLLDCLVGFGPHAVHFIVESEREGGERNLEAAQALGDAALPHVLTAPAELLDAMVERLTDLRREALGFSHLNSSSLGRARRHLGPLYNLWMAPARFR